MNAREMKKFEKLTEKFRTLSDEELLHEFEEISIWSAQEYQKVIESGKAKSLGLEMSAIAQEFMRRGIVDNLEKLLENKNPGIRADAADLLLSQGKSLEIERLLDILQNIQDSREDEYSSTTAFGALSRRRREQWMKEHT